MKRFPILSKVLLIICLSLMLYANVWVPPYPDPPPPPYKYINTAGSTINSIFIIPYVADDPVIDGLLDAAWTFPDVGMFVYANDDLPDGGHTDLSSLFRVAWNENGFYLWGHVIDDSIFASGSDPGEQDCFEIYFDGDNSKGVSYDGNDVRWRWVYGRTDVDSGWTDAGEWVWLETPNGYNFELAIPVADLQKGGTQLFELTEGIVFGFEVQCSDNDGEGRECIAKWWNSSSLSWRAPALFGTAILDGTNEDATQLEIVGVESAPTLDGELDPDWYTGEPPEVQMTSVTDRNLPDGGYLDFSTFYRAAWNADGFYFFGRVVDDIIYTAGANSYEQDCFEIYFDGDNSKGSSYDANDVQWRYVYGVTTDSAGWKDAGDVAWAENVGSWNFELAIPVADLQKGGTQLFELTEGTVFGFEVQCSDNDGEGRECMTKWWSESNYSWQQPVLFGTARLTLEGGGILEKLAYDIKLSLPSVISSNTTISYSIPARSSVRLTLFNSGGQAVRTLVNEVKDAGTTTVTLDASGLANGVYLCTLEACGGVITQKVTLIK